MTDDALGDDDVTALVARLRRRQVSPGELRAAVAARLVAVDPTLRGLGLDRADESTHHDVLLSPVLAHRTPPLGWLHPAVPFDELAERLVRYVGFAPLQNVACAPVIAVPAGRHGALPVGVQLAGRPGDEATLVELAFELESAVRTANGVHAV
ncbi:amidase family protein [Actinomycetospora chiangmaiensis]|uniref:amidase family protein n=1 Tax=Actinomycetospora chiangmaiensis TaxID=402650 RepID=UPI00036710FF|nr:amidase family protein [Actinomycetospora chiangmaiensis]